MATEFKLPEVSEGVEKATILSLLVSEGDTIEKDTNVIEIETDKASLEVPAGMAGKVAKIHVSEGDEIAVGATVLEVEQGDEGSSDQQQPKESKDKEEEKDSAEEEESSQKTPDDQPDDQQAKASDNGDKPESQSKASQPATENGDTLQAQLVVIGAGPGGYEAALHAADLGIDTVLVSDEDRLGGVCLQRGCIPSKALLNIGHILHTTKEAGRMGLDYQQPAIDIDRMRQFKDDVIDKLSKGIVTLCKSHKVRVVHARASFRDANTLDLTRDGQPPADGPRAIRFENCMIATGSRPVLPKAFDLGDPRLLDSSSALDLREVPGRLMVIGAGYIGLELGTVYASLGSEVTVVELLDDILVAADRDLVKPLRRRLDKDIKKILLGTKVEKLEAHDDGIHATLSKDGEQSTEVFDNVLLSMGRQPVTDGLGLEAAGVAVTEKGFIQIDSQCRTSVSHIYAIGDVAGDPMLAHKATREGKVAAEAIAGQKTEFDNIAIPSVVYTDPEIAWCGLNEVEATEKEIPYEVARFNWAASGRATALGVADGLTKILFDPESERVLGVGIVGSSAGDLISEGVVAVEMAAVARDVADSIHPHPTLSETLAEAAGAFLRGRH